MNSESPHQKSDAASDESSSSHSHSNSRQHHGGHGSSSRQSLPNLVPASAKHPRKRRRNRSSNYRVPLWSRIKEPILQCHRCGQRYTVSWFRDVRCTKCGRWPTKVKPWEAVLCGLFPPAAIYSAFIHRVDSPRNAAIVSLLGLAGLAVELGIFFLSRSVM